VLYLQHPNDAVGFFKFEEKFGKTWALPPKVWFRRGGFSIGDKFEFPDATGKLHTIEIGPSRRTKNGSYMTHLGIDYHPEPVVTPSDDDSEKPKTPVALSSKGIEALARMGDIRATLKGVVNQIPVAVDDEVADGDTLVVLEAMKMLTNIVSDVDGKVSEIFASPGSSVGIGDKLMLIKI
jgi:pyruvate carboxylase